MPRPFREGAALVERAPAKINLTLRVLGRRTDGFHELESLVAFAGAGDRLAFTPGGADWTLAITGPHGQGLSADDNLVLRAARAIERLRPQVPRGHFDLVKSLPVASGIGGGSSDAAAALRLLALASGLSLRDPALLEAAAEIGSDVPVCVDPRSRVFRGRGERLSPPVALPPIPAVLVNPGVAVSTAAVFAGLGLSPGAAPLSAETADPPRFASAADAIAWIAAGHNDLEAPARAICLAIDTALAELAAAPGCALTRMSGSGATVFGLFSDRHSATNAARALAASRSEWWIRSTLLR